MSLEFVWNADFEAVAYEPKDGSSLIIRGTLVDTSVNANKWALDETELENIAKQVKGSQLRIDHGKSVRDIIGGMTEGKYDRNLKKVFFEAEIDEPDIIRKVIKKRVGFVSVGMNAEAFCSSCGERTRPIKKCECKDFHENIKNSLLKETSIISEPAYAKTSFEPVSFVAGVEKVLSVPIIVEKVVVPEITPIINATTPESSVVVEEVKVTEVKGREESAIKSEIKLEEKEKMSENKEEVKATQLMPAGPDAFILLAEMTKKIDELCKKQEEVSGKIVKLEEAIKVKVKKEEDEEIEKPKKKEEPEEDEEEEEEEKPKEKVKKEIPLKGAKVDTSGDTEEIIDVSAQALIDKTMKEILGAARKFDIVSY